MNIQIDKIRIDGFRGVSNLEMSLSKVTVLIGQNNAGKTSVIKALQLALGDYSRYLSEEDFHIDVQEHRQETITVDLRFISIDDKGKRIEEFSDDWQREFGDKIQAEASNHQFLAIRTTAKQDKIRGGYVIERFCLEQWKEDWLTFKSRNRLNKRFDSIPFISVDAQRDIHSELKEKSSFIGKVLSSVEYDDADIKNIETMVARINEEATDKSKHLKKLKSSLDKLNSSLGSSGDTELTPFPKKLRDLSKRFSIHFGESDSHSFSMEYHGMGTRSWASMLTVKAFIELLRENHEEEYKPFLPIFAAEEPESHLHPNAQRTLFNQLSTTLGQIIISTHSPYVSGLAKPEQIRVLRNQGNLVKPYLLRDNLEAEDLRKLQREILHSRGELLFSKAIVLSEGETEEQVLPILFEAYTNQHPFSMGVNFIGVNGSGAKYRPFFVLAKDLNIPIFIFSDGESQTVKKLKKQYQREFGTDNDFESLENIIILDDTDFEGYLFECKFDPLIEDVINDINKENYIDTWINKKNGTVLKRIKTDKPPCQECKQPIYEDQKRDYEGKDGRKRAIMEILDKSKPLYAKAIADEIAKLPKTEFPPKIIKLFDRIMELEK